MKKLISIVIVLIFICQALFAQRTENIFIIVIDGARYSETFGDSTHQFMPKIWNQLRPMGTIYTSFYIDGMTKTDPGHASMLTGKWQYIAYDGTERPHQPTLFEYRRKQQHTPITDNYVVTSKEKLQDLAYSDHPDYGSDYRASVSSATNYGDDVETWDNLQEVMATYHPSLVNVNFGETDVAAHTGVWGNYVSALRQADSLTYELWNLIQSDSVYSNRTTMFVTNDHGRHLNSVSTGFRDHGDNCEGCRHIMLLVAGPETPAGAIDNIKRKQIDIAPTAGAMLNIATPFGEGDIIDTAIRVELSLVNNRTKPVNPSTTLQYSIQQSGFVQFTIYDELGKLVRKLVKGEKPAGDYSTVWDGKNEKGELVSSGAYFYTLKVGKNNLISKQMLWLK